MKKRPTKRKNTRPTPEALVDQAIRLFAKEGYSEVSVQRIADGCGVSQTAVLYHFPTKLRLVEAAIARVVAFNHQQVAQSFSVTDDALTRLRKHFRGNLEWAVQSPEQCQVILLLYYLATHRPEFLAIYQRIRQVARDRILELLAAGQREGKVRRDVDLPETASVLHDALLGGIVNWIATGRAKAASKQLVGTWESLFERFLV